MGTDHNETIQVQIGELGIGRKAVPYDPQTIERVRVVGYHGSPHVLPHEEPGKSWIEILGAVPNTDISVKFNVVSE